MRSSPLFIIFACALSLTSCTPVNVGVRSGSYSQDKALAKAAVERFHSQYNDYEFVAIYNEATLSFQSATPQKALVALMNQTKERYGQVVAGKLIGENAFPGGQVRLAYNTKFQKGETTELFTWQSDGKTARLQMVKISPGATPLD